MPPVPEIPAMSVLEEADARYVPFPPFEEWQACVVDRQRWESISKSVRSAKVDSTRFKRAIEVVRRVAAIQTGAIEGLYEADAGFTLTAATGAILVGAAQEPAESLRDRLIASQLDGYR